MRGAFGQCPVSAPRTVPLMRRVSKCESVVFCRAAPPRRGRAAKTSLSIQEVFDCKWYRINWECKGMRLHGGYVLIILLPDLRSY